MPGVDVSNITIDDVVPVNNLCNECRLIMRCPQINVVCGHRCCFDCMERMLTSIHPTCNVMDVQ